MGKLLLNSLNVLRFAIASSGSFVHIIHNYNIILTLIPDNFILWLVILIPVITSVVFLLVKLGPFKTEKSFINWFEPSVRIFTALISILPFLLVGKGEELHLATGSELTQYKIICCIIVFVSLIFLDLLIVYVMKLRLNILKTN